MGSTVQASCPCGFESDLLDVGGGMLDFGEVCLAPALAGRSGKLVVRNFWSKKRRGSRSGNVVFYTDPRLYEQLDEVARPGVVFEWRGGKGKPDFILPDIRYRCPACGDMSMRFALGNVMWD